MSHDWSDAAAGRPVATAPASAWVAACAGRLADADAALSASDDPVARALSDAVRAWRRPMSQPATLAAPTSPAERWSVAVACTARARPLPACPSTDSLDDPLVAEHLRLLAAPDPSPAATTRLRTLASRRDAVGARAALDLGARTPDRLLATRLLGDGLARARQLGQRLTAAHALRLLAHRAVADGRGAEAVPLLHRALRLDRAAGSLVDELNTRRQLDAALVALNQSEARLDALRAWADAARRAEDLDLEGWICSATGHTALRTRHDDIAHAAFRRAAAVARVHGDNASLDADLEGLERAASRLGLDADADAARTERAALPEA